MVYKHTIIILAYVIITTFFRIQQVTSSGVFELRLKSFTNENGKDNLGLCCSGIERANRCVGSCKTRFRICLKHYQAKIDTTTACTYGDVMTPILGDNNVVFPDTDTSAGFNNPIRFPFDFAWPGTFSLIIEAWHDATNLTYSSGNGGADVPVGEHKTSTSPSSGIPPPGGGGGGGRSLIGRVTTQKWLEVTSQWTDDEKKLTHSKIKYEFRVTCDEHYYGTGCANLCRPRDDNFGHYSCSPTGDRICLSGWKGDYCTKPRCLAGCDEQHGHCTKPDECLCHSGWKGRLCDQCEKYPGCLHGTCQKPWDCLCDEGWGGLFCNQDLNYCTNYKPCRNGGTCFNTGQGSYTCSCPPGYAGTDCDIKLTNCSHKPCLNGAACKENGSSYQCECSKGWYGTHCEIAVQTCEDKPCKHGATCMDSIHGYKCLCPSGYTGPECQQAVNHCQPNPCNNGGVCTVMAENSGYTCGCPAGFIGANCQTNVDDCVGAVCQNGGTCVDLIDDFRCQCVPGYVGEFCQNEVNYCVAKPCANGGLCENLVNDYKCKCRPGFAGKDCSVFVDECKSNPCLNGGSCYNRDNGFKCDCPGQYEGVLCELAANSSSSSSSFSSVTHASPMSGGRSSSSNGGQQQSSSTADPSRGHWYVIAALSTSVPILVLIAALVVSRMKHGRRKEQKRADEEARMQNEQNSSTAHGGSKRGDPHMIKNTWGQCGGGGPLKNVDDAVGGGVGLTINGTADLCYPKPIYTASATVLTPNTVATSQQMQQSSPSQQQHQPMYTLQRSRSQKQLNVDPPSVLRHSVIYPNRVSCKDLLESNTIIIRTNTPAPLDNRISLLSSVNTSYSNLSDSSLSKQQLAPTTAALQLLDKEKSLNYNNNNSNINNNSSSNNINNNNSVNSTSANTNSTNSVYLIDEHFNQNIFATEV